MTTGKTYEYNIISRIFILYVTQNGHIGHGFVLINGDYIIYINKSIPEIFLLFPYHLQKWVESLA